MSQGRHNETRSRGSAVIACGASQGGTEFKFRMPHAQSREAALDIAVPPATLRGTNGGSVLPEDLPSPLPRGTHLQEHSGTPSPSRGHAAA